MTWGFVLGSNLPYHLPLHHHAMSHFAKKEDFNNIEVRAGIDLNGDGNAGGKAAAGVAAPMQQRGAAPLSATQQQQEGRGTTINAMGAVESGIASDGSQHRA
jgi:hypothetical protein